MMFQFDLNKNINMWLIDLDILNSLELLWIDYLNSRRIFIIRLIWINLLLECLLNIQAKVLILN